MSARSTLNTAAGTCLWRRAMLTNICKPTAAVPGWAGVSSWTMPLPACVQCRSPGAMVLWSPIESRLTTPPGESSSSSVTALMPPCGCGRKKLCGMQNASTPMNGSISACMAGWNMCAQVRSSNRCRGMSTTEWMARRASSSAPHMVRPPPGRTPALRHRRHRPASPRPHRPGPGHRRRPGAGRWR